MLTVNKDRISPFADAEIERLERLLSDLKRVRDGEGPTDAELAAAPFLAEFRLAQRPVPCLAGLVVGHPTLGDTTALTTDVWAYAPTLGWARTLSRFYRLGELVRPTEP